LQVVAVAVHIVQVVAVLVVFWHLHHKPFRHRLTLAQSAVAGQAHPKQMSLQMELMAQMVRIHVSVL
jgi:hypothetical protein